MKKEEIEKKVLKDGKAVYLSAQEYERLTPTERGVLREVLSDPDDYEREMKALWPKKFEPQKLKWRR